MKKYVIFLFLLSLILPLSACKNTSKNLETESKNLTSYEINLEINTEKKQVIASQNINYINNTNSILKHIKFHLYPKFFEQDATELIVPNTKMNNAFPNGINYSKFDINRVTVENIDKTINLENEYDSILNIELNSSLMPNEKTTITIEYSFSIPNCNHRFGYGENTINLANFYPIACVYQNGNFNTNGYHPNGDPFFSDMANYSVNIVTDKQYIVAGTGEKINENIQENKKYIRFNAKIVRDFAIVLSNKFKVLSQQNKQTKIEYYYFNDPNPQQSLTTGIDAIKTFSKLFGEYPYSTFSIVECDFIHGGMEYPNLVMISSSIENQEDYLNVIIHETAHQWWYGIVGNDEFTYPWLDEALTEFSTILFYDYNNDYSLNHKQMINISKENYSLFISVYEDVLGNINTSMRAVNEYETEPEYTYCTYVKGVLMFESLYQLIGEKNFINSLKLYYSNNKFNNVEPNDLILAFNKTTNQELSNFFNSWTSGKVIIK